MLYFPDVLPASASTQLSRMIRRDPEMLSDLRRAGYRKGQRIYTPLQVRTLVEHLGDPESWALWNPDRSRRPLP